MTMSGTGPGRGVSGFIPDATNPFDPVLDGYPASNPMTGFIPKDEGFAGIIFGQPTDGSPTLSLYCFDLFTDTWPGLGYALGTWDAATVPNVGYVARILNEYYPFVPTQPAGLANTTEQAAAVQAAIWFFSDRYVLNTSDPLHDTVAAIVAHIISEGPATAPPAPSLAITPTNASGASTRRHRRPVHGDLRNRVGHGDGDRGQHVFGRSRHRVHRQRGHGDHARPDLAEDRPDRPRPSCRPRPRRPCRSKTSTSTTGTPPGLGDAQRLILALDSELTTTVTANAEFKAVGSLVVQKTIAGPAAGSQGQVTIHTVCDGTALTPDFVVASGTPAGTSSRTYTGIPSGSLCTITETANGTERTTNVLVDVTGDGQQVTIPAEHHGDGHGDRHLRLRARVPYGRQDHRRIRGGTARAGHHPCGVSHRYAPHSRLRHPGGNAGGRQLDDVQRYPRQYGLYRHRDSFRRQQRRVGHGETR